MTAVAGAVADATLDDERTRLAETMVRWLENAVRPDDLFADDMLLDLSIPQWRVQTLGAANAFAIREDDHPYPGSVRVTGLDHTSRGFLLEFEERWEAEDQGWYCRELMHCVVTAGRISELIVYCTGDWDAAVQRQHSEQVRLIRP